MMITGRDVTVQQMQHEDRLRQAEQERLLKQLATKEEKTSLWQSLHKLLVSDNQPERGHSRLAKESA